MGKNKYKGLRSYAQEKVTAPKKIVRGGKVEELSYINKDEAKLLKRLGASGKRTPHGVKSYTHEEGHEESGLPDHWETIKDYYTEGPHTNQGDKFDTSAEGAMAYQLSLQNQGSGGQAPPKKVPVPSTEYIDNPGSIDLKSLYEASGTAGGITAYLDGFKERSATSAETSGKPTTNASGGSITYKVKPLDHGIPDDFAASDFKTDNAGNIIGWTTSSGGSGFNNSDQWMYDSDQEEWYFVGEGSAAGAGGTGTTEVIENTSGDPNNPSYSTTKGGVKTTNVKTVGARTYASLLGFDQTKLDAALVDRKAIVDKIKAKEEVYGGKWVPATATTPGHFEGGKEQKYLEDADLYDEELKHLMGFDIGKKGEAGYRAKDTFYADLEAEARGLPVDMQRKLYGAAADEITAATTEQTADLEKMMSERGIDPTSPQAMRLRQQIKRGVKTEQRQARRSSLADAMQVGAAQRQERMGIRGQRLGGMAGLSASAFERGTYFGAKSDEMRNIRMSEAVDRQNRMEQMQLAGTEMNIAKYGGEENRKLAEKIAQMQKDAAAQTYRSGGSSFGQDLFRTGLGAFVGGAMGKIGSAWLAGLSDKKLKKKVKSAKPRATREDVGELLDSLRAYNYEYKKEEYGKGRRLGIMAQDLEKTKLGKKAVVDTPVGKVVDVWKGLGIALAAQAYLNKKYKHRKSA